MNDREPMDPLEAVDLLAGIDAAFCVAPGAIDERDLRRSAEGRGSPALVQAHLERCPQCRAVFREYLRLHRSRRRMRVAVAGGILAAAAALLLLWWSPRGGAPAYQIARVRGLVASHMGSTSSAPPAPAPGEGVWRLAGTSVVELWLTPEREGVARAAELRILVETASGDERPIEGAIIRDEGSPSFPAFYVRLPGEALLRAAPAPRALIFVVGGQRLRRPLELIPSG